MAEPYRFGGPIPERAKLLMDRRRYRSSEFFTNLKRRRGEAFDKDRSGPQSDPRSPEHASAALAARPLSHGSCSSDMSRPAPGASDGIPSKTAGSTARLLMSLSRACISLLRPRESQQPSCFERELRQAVHLRISRLPLPDPTELKPGSAQPLPPARAGESE